MSSFDQVIKNILSDLFGSNEQEDVVRPQARPSGLGAPTTSPRPRLRPEQDDDDEVAIPSGSEATSKFIAAMADYDDTPEQGVDIPLSTLQTDARNLNGKYKTTAMQLAKLNKGAPLTDGGRANVKVAGIEEDSTLDDLLFDVKVAMNRRSLEEIPLSEKPVVGQGFDMSVKDIQIHLNSRGYDVGGIDGKMGPKTRAAIRSFQKDEGLSVDGIAGKNTQRALQTEKPLAPITVTELGDIDPSVTTPDESRFIARPLDEFMPNLNIGSIRDIKLDTTAIQTKLSGLGYDVGEIDGKIGKRTRKAIRQFQKDKGLVADGIVGPDTTEAMIRAERMSNVDEETGMPEVKDSSVLSGLGNLLGNLGLGTSEFRFFAGNLTNPGSTRTEKSLNKSDMKALRSAVNIAMQDGRSYTTYEDFGFDEMEVNKYSPLSGVIDPDLRMARSVGVFNFDINDKGNVVIEDTFDFNPGPKRIAYYEAVKKGNKKEALAMLADASPVQAASMVGYAKQESLKEQDKPYETQININLGKPDTWS